MEQRTDKPTQHNLDSRVRDKKHISKGFFYNSFINHVYVLKFGSVGTLRVTVDVV